MRLPPFYQMIMSLIADTKDSDISRGSIRRLIENLEDGLNLIETPPEMGGDTLALSLAIHLAKSGKRVLYCGTHKTKDAYIRCLCHKSGVKFPLNPTEEERSRLKITSASLKELLLNYDLLPFYNIHYIQSELQEDIERLHIDYLFIDSLKDIYRNIYQDEWINSEAIICKHLRGLTHIPIIAVDELNYLPGHKGWQHSRLLDFAVNKYFVFRADYYGIYKDKHIERDFKNKMYVYVAGRSKVDEEIYELILDRENGCVYESEMQVETINADNM